METPTRDAAVLFADVAGSTRLYEQVGDATALLMIARCMDVMREVCEERGGRVVKTIGDEVMAVFTSAANAGYAASDMHGRITELTLNGGPKLAIHVGVQWGPVIDNSGDVYGDTVNVAARLCSAAKGGQTLMGKATLDQLPPPLKVRTRSQDVAAVKGKHDDLELYELCWEDSDDDLTSIAPRRAGRQARLTLRYGAREIEVADANALTFGRDDHNDFVILDRKASRMHARIERRRDKYVLIDHSTNGTFLTVHGEGEVELRREELQLRGRGRIIFGHPAVDDPSSDVVEFDTHVST
jgi:class 3 adenylate cyclase